MPSGPRTVLPRFSTGCAVSRLSRPQRFTGSGSTQGRARRPTRRPTDRDGGRRVPSVLLLTSGNGFHRRA